MCSPGSWQAGAWGPLFRLHLAGPLSSPQGAYLCFLAALEPRVFTRSVGVRTQLVPRSLSRQDDIWDLGTSLGLLGHHPLGAKTELVIKEDMLISQQISVLVPLALLSRLPFLTSVLWAPVRCPETLIGWTRSYCRVASKWPAAEFLWIWCNPPP